jgi:hypothetical protein
MQLSLNFHTTSLPFNKIGSRNLKQLRSLLEGIDSNDTYMKSYLYHAYTGRQRIESIQNNGLVAIIHTHPNLKNCFLIFFPTNVEDEDFLHHCSLLESYQSRFQNHNILIGRIPRQITDGLFSGKREVTSNGFSLRLVEERVLDWRYPSYDVSLTRLAEPVGRDLSIYRKKIRKFRKQSISILRLGDVRMLGEVEAAILGVNRQWIQTKIAERPDNAQLTMPIADLSDPYECIARLALNTEIEIDGIFLKRDDKYIGFALWQQVNSGVVPCLAALPACHERGLSEYIYFQVTSVLSGRGHTEMCIGGSETYGLDHFKRKLAPIRSHLMSTVKLSFAKRINTIKYGGYAARLI